MKAWFPALLCTGLLLAQTVVPKAVPIAGEADPGRIVLDVTRVNMLFTVTDKKGRFITDLKKDDFQVIESSHPAIHRRKRSSPAPRPPRRHQQQHPRPFQVRTAGGHFLHQQRRSPPPGQADDRQLR
jgi:hypothetical protein